MFVTISTRVVPNFLDLELANLVLIRRWWASSRFQLVHSSVRPHFSVFSLSVLIVSAPLFSFVALRAQSVSS